MSARTAVLFALVVSSLSGCLICNGPEAFDVCTDEQYPVDTWDTADPAGTGGGGLDDIAVWALEDASFGGDARLTGFVVIDHGSGEVVDWDICSEASDGWGVPPVDPTTDWPGFRYTPQSSWTYSSDASDVSFNSNALFGPYSNSFRSLRLGKAPKRGRTRDVEHAVECINCWPSRYLVSGRLVEVATVEEARPESCE